MSAKSTNQTQLQNVFHTVIDYRGYNWEGIAIYDATIINLHYEQYCIFLTLQKGKTYR
jgi:hypothetical protein